MKYIHNFIFEKTYFETRGYNSIKPWTSYTKNRGIDYNYKNIDERMLYIPLTFDILSSGNITWSLGNKTVQYSKNNGDWTTMNSSTTISVVKGDAVSFKGTNQNYNTSHFSSTAQFNIKGNIMSLTNADNFELATSLGECAFEALFLGCTTLISAKYLKLPVKILNVACYHSMFLNCTNLKTAPELPATTLAEGCYREMFKGCTSLEKAPILPVTTLVEGCYREMFKGCTSLNYIRCLATDISASNCLNDWVSGVSSKGIFVKENSMNQWTSGTSGIPNEWSISGKYLFKIGNRYVEFASGNVQALNVYEDTDTIFYARDWQFANEQYTSFKTNGTLRDSNDVDLFCWVGESADYNSYGLSKETTYDNPIYGTVDDENLKDDWGNIPAICSKYGTGWRTPSIDEWTYLIHHYTIGYVFVNDVVEKGGLMIFPQEVNPQKYISHFKKYEESSENQLDNDGRMNFISIDVYRELDRLGVLFLPDTDYRDGINVIHDISYAGYYWSSTASSVKHAYRLAFDDYAAGTTKYKSRRHYGRAVRLIRDL